MGAGSTNAVIFQSGGGGIQETLVETLSLTHAGQSFLMSDPWTHLKLRLVGMSANDAFYISYSVLNQMASNGNPIIIPVLDSAADPVEFKIISPNTDEWGMLVSHGNLSDTFDLAELVILTGVPS